jgi:hypothetical protein
MTKIQYFKNIKYTLHIILNQIIIIYNKAINNVSYLINNNIMFI